MVVLTAPPAAQYQTSIRRPVRKARAASRAEVARATERWITWQERARARAVRAWHKRIKDAFVRLRRRVEKELPKVVGSAPGIIRQSSSLSAPLAKADLSDFRSLEEVIIEWAEKDLQKIFTGLYLDAFRVTGEGLDKTLGIYMPLGIGGDPEAERWAQLSAGIRVRDIGRDTANSLRDHISRCLNLGLPVEQIAYGAPPGPERPWRPGGKAIPGIASMVEETYRNRALTIARTETAMAFNIAAYRRFSRAGVKRVKVLDDHGPGSCEVCAEAHGQIWSMEEALRRPIEHPNCRRAFAPIIPAFDEEPPERQIPDSPIWRDRPWMKPAEPFDQYAVIDTSDTRRAIEYMFLAGFPEEERKIDTWDREQMFMNMSRATDEVRSNIKHNLVSRIAERAELPEDRVNEMVKAWAASSGDSVPLSVLLQVAAAEVFGVESAYYPEEKLTELWRIMGWDAEWGAVEQAQEQARRFVRTVYEITQEELAWKGIKTIRLYRGLSIPVDSLPPMVERDDNIIHMSNPLSSWSLDISTAQIFMGEATEDEAAVILAVEVPVERVFSTCITGPGCYIEQEVVLIGGIEDETNIADIMMLEEWQGLYGPGYGEPAEMP